MPQVVQTVGDRAFAVVEQFSHLSQLFVKGLRRSCLWWLMLF